ncbi:MAG TPA: hypothetical protein VFS75_03305 [Candidatus Paceibacterota bacterium]|nr:hypothetical protein [Candidatus Paceibacterota bacterium]
MRTLDRSHKALYYALAVAAGVLLFGLEAAAAPDPAVTPESAVTAPTPARGRTALSSAVQDRIVNLASNISLRLTAATGRYGDIIARLQTRMEKMRAAGADTAAAEAKLAEAKASLTEAMTALDALGSVKDAISGETPRESFRAVRTNILAIRDDLKKTHALLRDTIALLKDALRASNAEKGVSDAVSNAPESTTAPATSE